MRKRNRGEVSPRTPFYFCESTGCDGRHPAAGKTGTGGQSMVHAPETLQTTAKGEPGPRPDKKPQTTPSRDKDRDMRR